MRYTPEEQAQHRKEWVEALRSGKYQQSQGRLRSAITYSTGYCCLGVACDISGLSSWEIAVTGLGYIYMGENTCLPNEVADYFGISQEGVLTEVDDSTDQETLIGMNDSGESFEKIAKFIEKDWVLTK